VVGVRHRGDLAGEDQLALVAGRAVVVEHGDLPLEDGSCADTTILDERKT
jgi:hypothetical protein